MKSKIAQISLFILVLGFIVFSGVGFATYGASLFARGTAVLKPQGKIRISNVVLSDSNNLTNTENPSFSDESVDFHFEFNGAGQEDTYYAVYNITISNDSFYDYAFGSDKFTPDIDFGDTQNATIDFTFEGIEEGERIPAGTSRTFAVRVTLTPLDDSGSYSADASVEADTTAELHGSLLGSIDSGLTGDLTGTNTIAGPYTVSVINSYQSSKTFTLSPTDSTNFSITDASGNPLSYTIAAGETNDYTFYIKRLNTTGFATSPQQVTVMIKSTDIPSSAAGNVEVEVDIDTTASDTGPPIISDVTITKSSTVGTATVSWSGSDESGISNYTVTLYKKDGTQVEEKQTVGSETSIAFTGVKGGSDYYAVVYGKDTLNKEPDAQTISGATTAAGYASRSADTPLSWKYTITYKLTRLSHDGPSEIEAGEKLTVHLSASGSYSTPSMLDSVTMGGKTLTTSQYSYDSRTATITINSVTGNVVITAEASGGGGCLAEGTLIKMADGSYKRIEAIEYDDLVAVWNQTEGKEGSAYPVWIEKEEEANEYTKVTFSDGSHLNIVKKHGLFDIKKNEYIDTSDKRFKKGLKVAKIDKNGNIESVWVIKIEKIKEKVKYYHVVTAYNYNLIANDILTTDDAVMLSNLYGFDENIKWPKEREKILKTNDYTYDTFKDTITRSMYEGFRAKEIKLLVDNKYITLDEFKGYLLENQMNEEMYKKPITNIKGKTMWMVTTTNDKITEKNKYKFLKEEGSTYTFPKKRNIKYYIDSSNDEKYKPGDKIKVYYGMHFIIKRSD